MTLLIIALVVFVLVTWKWGWLGAIGYFVAVFGICYLIGAGIVKAEQVKDSKAAAEAALEKVQKETKRYNPDRI